MRQHRDEVLHLTRGNLERRRLPLLREVLSDLGVAVQLAVRIAQRGDDHARPEPRAVLAHPPALVLGAAMLARHGQLAPRLAGVDVFGSVEAREMLADDLVRLVALDASRATVPARHRPVRSQHVDGVVLYALDQQTEAFLAAAQLLLLPLAPRDIARDLGEGEQLAALVAQRGDYDMGPEPGAVLAHTPPFVLEAPFHGGALQLELRPFALDIRLRIEDR